MSVTLLEENGRFMKIREANMFDKPTTQMEEIKSMFQEIMQLLQERAGSMSTESRHALINKMERMQLFLT